jgi:hypothetical protein
MASQKTQAAAYFTYLIQDCGYLDPRDIEEGRYVCIMPLMFTHAIIVGRIGQMSVYDDRWCYSSYDKAKAALDAWDGKGEPEGWHRHPMTGRRREFDGDEMTSEYVAM